MQTSRKVGPIPIGMKRRSQAGFSALEVMIALGVSTLLATAIPPLYDKWFEHQATNVAGEHMRVVAEAATAYIRDNYNLVAANATPTVPAVITTAMMRATGHLQASFSDRNAYGQSYRVLVLEPTANKLQTLIITEGGEAIKELSLRAIAKQVGAEGGYVSTSDPASAEGSFAGWKTSLAPYGVAPGAGHLATALFFQDGTLVNDYLYRHAVPGKPELQRMNAAIDMNGNNLDSAGTVTAGKVTSDYVQLNAVVTEGASCSPNGLVARNANGKTVSCESGVWKSGGDVAGIGTGFMTGIAGQYYNRITGGYSCPAGLVPNLIGGVQIGGCNPCLSYSCSKP